MVKLIISPLWFVGVYVVLVALVPAAMWLHRKLDLLVLVWLGGIAMVVDVLRFRFGLADLGWINMAVGVGSGAPGRVLPPATGRRAAPAGPVAAVGRPVRVGGPGVLRSVPPTFVIVALLAFQIGLAEVTRPAMYRRRARQPTSVINRFALPLFLFHSTGMALARAVDYFVFSGRIVDDRDPDLI